MKGVFSAWAPLTRLHGLKLSHYRTAQQSCVVSVSLARDINVYNIMLKAANDHTIDVGLHRFTYSLEVLTVYCTGRFLD
jgi:hypothetical protein